MRAQLGPTVDALLKSDEKAILLFGDVGTYGFRFAARDYPDRVYNVGILEQSMISIAAGLAMRGFIPVVHTIAAFMVERAFEQIKIDFGYQHLGGNFVSVAASYDNASWGCTHQSPGDVALLKNVPGMEIVVPGTAKEFDTLFNEAYNDGKPTYFRLTNHGNAASQDVTFGKANVIKSGSQATVIAVGPMLDRVTEACRSLDVTILYYTTLSPFDGDILRANLRGGNLVVCEPYYSGACALDIANAIGRTATAITYIGVPREFPHHYGAAGSIDAYFKLGPDDIQARLWEVCSDSTALQPLIRN